MFPFTEHSKAIFGIREILGTFNEKWEQTPLGDSASLVSGIVKTLKQHNCSKIFKYKLYTAYPKYSVLDEFEFAESMNVVAKDNVITTSSKV